MLMVPMVLDAGQTAGDVLEVLAEISAGDGHTNIVMRWRAGVAVRWFVIARADVIARCAAVAPTVTAAIACELATRDREEAERCNVADLAKRNRSGHGWLIVFSGERMIGAMPPVLMSRPPSAEIQIAPVPERFPPSEANNAKAPAPKTGGSRAGGIIGSIVGAVAGAISSLPGLSRPAVVAPSSTRGPTRGQHAKPPEAPTPAGAVPADDGVARGIDAPTASGAAADDQVDTLIALPRVQLDDRCTPAQKDGLLLTIGLMAADAPTTPGVMSFTTARSAKTIDIDVMVEAPDFTCDAGWKHTLSVDKSDPFAKSLELHIVPVALDDATIRVATVRIHYSYKGQPAGMAVRRVALGDATAAEAATLKQTTAAPLQIAPTATPVDLTIRIARRDESDAARELLWTILDCAYPAVVLPNAPLVQKVGDRDTTSSFASKVTSQVNAADGTVTIDTMLRGIGTLIRRAIPAEVLTVLSDVAASVGTDRLARILLLTDECFIPWELALLDPAPNAARAPFLGAQFAVSRWIHGESDVPVPPPATLVVNDLAVVLGNYDASSLNALPHAKEESAALVDQATKTPTRFPHVTSVNASPESMVDLLNGALPTPTGTLAPEMVHFACHGEVLGSGISKRSVLYMSDGTALSETLFVASSLGKTKKSFLFMNACQVGVGGDELNQYAGFPGFAISAGFSGFVGPLWSVNDQIAKSIAIDFYTRAFGADGSAPRPVADVLADMRSQYASEPDPKKRQSTWLAYVHYGHPHFTLSHA